jgi:uncharacterized membrane protein
MKRNTANFLLIVIFKLFSSQLLAQNTVQFIDLGPGGGSKVSDNGVYVCGNNYPAPAFLWSETAGRINLGVINYSEAFGVTNEGVVAGTYLDSTLLDPNGNPTFRAGYYQNNIWNPLPGYPGYPVLDQMSYTNADGITSDGSVIVGMQWTPNYKTEAVYWDNTGIHLLGRTGGGSSRSLDIAGSLTNFIIAGWDGEVNGPDRRAFYWDPAPHFMGGYDTSYAIGEAHGISTDGSKIVGGSNGVPFLWTETDGMQWITTDFTNTGSKAKDISDNGIIVGYVDVGGFNYQSFIKKPGWSDIVFLKSYLIDSLGVTGISDWIFSFANSISADGLVITGTAYPPSGGPNAYVIKLPDPLPVELISFTAAAGINEIILNWATGTETNNLGFEIERKTELTEWQEVGFINGNGTTTDTKFYSFTDNSITSNKYYYRLKQIDLDGTFEYSNTVQIDFDSPAEFSLEQNFPNPFNPSTIIPFTLPLDSDINLSVYNSLGEKVAELINGNKIAGTYNIEFNGEELSSGIYLYRLETGNFISSKKMILIK